MPERQPAGHFEKRSYVNPSKVSHSTHRPPDDVLRHTVTVGSQLASFAIRTPAKCVHSDHREVVLVSYVVLVAVEVGGGMIDVCRAVISVLRVRISHG